MSKTLAQKLLSVQQSIEKVTKGSSNPHFRSKYADLNEVLDVSKGALNAEGVFISQGSGKDAFGQYVETSLIDADSGQQLAGRVYFSGNEDNMQKIGAAITYARRFGLVSLLALESEDDDGETAIGRGKAEKVQSSSKTPAPAPRVGGVPSESKVAVPSNDRETLNKRIRQTAKVLADTKKQPLEVSKALVDKYGGIEAMTDEQAEEVIVKLEEVLKK